MNWNGIIHAYRPYLPVSRKTPVVTLKEGNTPLIPSPKLGKLVGEKARVFVKYEGLNPTGSFKDRGMTVAISRALEKGARAVICASTGNTSAAAAAYAARAGLSCFVLLPAGKIARGKLAQALICGARVISVKGNFDDALRLVREISENYPVAIVNSTNPDRIEGQKTASFEIIDQLGRAPDLHFLPVGNAGNITAYWKGYREWKGLRKISGLPRMMGIQAAGAAPIFRNKIVPHPETIATAIRIGNPASWKSAVQAMRESGGIVKTVTDREILHAQRWLAAEEGIFVEPASAASIAGLFQWIQKGGPSRYLKKSGDPTIVCTVTGHGLKDPDVTSLHKLSSISVKASLKEIVKVMDL